MHAIGIRIIYYRFCKEFRCDCPGKYAFNPAMRTSYDDVTIFKRYSFNMELSAEVGKAIHIFEVLLRNSITKNWNEINNCSDWPQNKIGIPKEKAYERILEDIDGAKKRVKKKDINNDDVIASLMLGFWLRMLEPKFDEQNILLIKKIFSNKRDWNSRLITDIRKLHEDIDKISYLRNRISHHEPIFHWRDLGEKYDLIVNLIKYIDEESLYLLRENQLKYLLTSGWNK